jgi:hypothetical protein
MTARPCSSAALLAVIIAAALVSACGGNDNDESSIELDQLTSIAGVEAVDGRQLNEEIIKNKDALWEAVVENDLTDGWNGGYRAQYVEVAGDLERVEVSIDVYGSSNAAQRRAAAEWRLNDDFLKESLSPAVVVEEFDDETGIESCSALSIKHPAIIPQYEVYCYEGTAVVFAKAIGTDEAIAIDTATRLAKGITEALQAAEPEPS